MPALPSPGKVIRLDFIQTYGADVNVRNHLFMQYTGSVSAADLATYLATWSSSWNTNIAPLLSTDHTLTSILGTDLSSATGAQAVNSTARAGTAAGASLPGGSALVIRFKIARRYRGGKPRWYFTALRQSLMSGDQNWTAGAITSFQSGFAAFITGGNTLPPAAIGTINHVSVGYFKGFHNVTTSTGRQKSFATVQAVPSVDAVLSYSVNPRIAAQRRRNLQSP